MPSIATDSVAPHFVVPNLIVRTPLPTGSAPVTMTHIAELQNYFAGHVSRIDVLKAWREDVADPALTSLASDVADVEVGIAPVGSIMMWPKATAPARWLLCDGTTYMSSLYPELAALIGTGGATFTVPDMRDMFVRGFNGVGALLDTFDDATRAPRSVTAIPTTGGSTSHKHTITSGKLNSTGGHTPVVTIGYASTDHTHVVDSSGNHKHTIDAVANHQHGLGAVGVTAFTSASLYSALVALPYSGNESIYNNLDVAGGAYTFMPTYDPQAYGYGHITDLWLSGAAGGHTPSIATETGAHTHLLGSSTASHKHNADVAPISDHTHYGETDNGEILHQHSVDKTTGWDTETRPKGILMNFIIRY